MYIYIYACKLCVTVSWTDGCIDARTDGRTDGGMGGWMDGWMDELNGDE